MTSTDRGGPEGPSDRRVVELHVPKLQLRPGPPGMASQLVRLGQGVGERLLTEHGQAPAERGPGDLAMGPGAEDQGRVHPPAVQQLLGRAAVRRPAQPEPLADLHGQPLREVADGRDLEPIPERGEQRQVHRLGDGAEPDHSQPHPVESMAHRRNRTRSPAPRLMAAAYPGPAWPSGWVCSSSGAMLARSAATAA